MNKEDSGEDSVQKIEEDYNNEIAEDSKLPSPQEDSEGQSKQPTPQNIQQTVSDILMTQTYLSKNLTPQKQASTGNKEEEIKELGYEEDME